MRVGCGIKVLLCLPKRRKAKRDDSEATATAKTTAKTRALRLVGCLHPTHRKVRDGWGTRAFVAGGGELQRQ